MTSQSAWERRVMCRKDKLSECDFGITIQAHNYMINVESTGRIQRLCLRGLSNLHAWRWNTPLVWIGIGIMPIGPSEVLWKMLFFYDYTKFYIIQIKNFPDITFRNLEIFLRIVWQITLYKLCAVQAEGVHYGLSLNLYCTPSLYLTYFIENVPLHFSKYYLSPVDDSTYRTTCHTVLSKGH